MAAPTLVSYTSVTSWITTGTPKTISSVAVQAGDRIVILAAVEDNSFTLGTPSDGGVNTYTSAQNASAASHARAAIWTATAATTTSLNFSETCSSGSAKWGYAVLIYRSSAGFGNSANTTAGDPTSVAVTTTAANSALACCMADWNAVDGTSTTYLQVNSASPTQRQYQRDAAAYTAYVFTYADAGTAAAKTIGTSAPTGTRPTAVVIEVKAAAGGASVTGTATCLITAARVAIGTPKVLGTIVRAFTASAVAIGTPKALGTAQLTETFTGVAVATPKVRGLATASFASTATAVGTRKVTGTALLAETFTRTAVGTPTVKGVLLQAESFTASAYVDSLLHRDLHQSIGHAPASIADYELAFSPNTASGGWHRGDGGHSILGATWQLFCFNDFFRSDGVGGVGAFPVNNGVLEVGTDGEVYWLSGGNGGAQGTITFPDMTGGRVMWLKGGWPLGADSAVLLCGNYAFGSLISLQVMKVSGIGTSEVVHGAVHAVGINLSAGITWGNDPYIQGGYVYLHGIHFGTFAAHVTRCALSLVIQDYEVTWEMWTGSTWTAGGTPGGVPIGTGPLAALAVIAQNPDYGVLLASSKEFNTSPEVGIPDTWSEIRGWTASAPEGPWTYSGVFYQPTTVTDWYSYSARIDRFLGVERMLAIWSLNASAPTFDADVYGPQLADARNQLSGDAARSITFGATAAGTPRKVGTATGGSSFTATAAGRRVVSGAGATSVTFVASSVGTPRSVGLATCSIVFGASASGTTAGSVAGSGAAALVFNVATLGTVRIYGVTLVTITDTAIAVGRRTVSGTGSSAFSWAAAAAGLPAVGGVLGVALSFTGTASGAGVGVGGGSASASFSFTASAVGTPRSTGTAAASFSFTATAAGTRPMTGSAVTTVTFTASAVGTSARGGAGTATFVFGTAAVGRPVVLAQATASPVFSGSAEGDRAIFGSAQALLVLAGTLAGSGYVPAEGMGGRVVPTPEYGGSVAAGAAGELAGSVTSGSTPGGIISASDNAMTGGIS